MTLLVPGEVPADDRGLLLGDGVFETVRLYGGRPFRLASHLDRLLRSAAVMGLSVPEALPRRVAAAVEEWGEREGSLRITLTRGSGPGLAPPPDSEPRLLIAITPVPAAFEKARKGLRAVVRGHVDERALAAGVKALGYAERILAFRLAREAGADEALLTNTKGRLVEGCTSNLIAVNDGVLLAPGEAEGALSGITREVILEVAERAGYRVEEKGIRPEEAREMSELLLSSSVREVVPVVEVDGHRIGDGTPGKAFRELTTGFRAVVEGECR